MTIKHTPSPWHVAQTISNRGARIEHHVAYGNGHTTHVVARVSRKIDARLIAAAPDLLAALRMARAYIRDGDGRIEQSIAEHIDAAIAKAGG